MSSEGQNFSRYSMAGMGLSNQNVQTPSLGFSSRGADTVSKLSGGAAGLAAAVNPWAGLGLSIVSTIANVYSWITGRREAQQERTDAMNRYNNYVNQEAAQYRTALEFKKKDMKMKDAEWEEYLRQTKNTEKAAREKNNLVLGQGYMQNLLTTLNDPRYKNNFITAMKGNQNALA